METRFFLRIALASILLNICTVQPAKAQQLNKAKLDSLFDIMASKNKAMGSIAISKNGTLLYNHTIGYSFISDTQRIASTNNTKYRIGSISKMFTAVITFQLIEEGKLTLTTTIDKYFPTLPNAKEITISNLLNHRSGLHNFTEDSAYTQWMTQAKTEDEMIRTIAAGKPVFQPNEKALYSNSNFVVLGYIVEKICKEPLKQLIRERITQKIGLTNTYYGGKTDLKNNESYSYVFGTGWQQQPETDMSIPGGAGAIVSTSADLTKFIEALFAGKLISKGSLHQMKTMTDGYGMAMFEFPFYDKKAYGHNGSIDGFGSVLVYFPKDSLAVAYCSNGTGYSINNILIGVLSIYFDMPYQIPSFKSITLKPEDLDKYTGIYSSTQIALKITITKNNATLIAQATGQSSFALETTDKDVFKYGADGIEMDFTPEKNQFTLKQGGANYLYTKDK